MQIFLSSCVLIYIGNKKRNNNIKFIYIGVGAQKSYAVVCCVILLESTLLDAIMDENLHLSISHFIPSSYQ